MNSRWVGRRTGYAVAAAGAVALALTGCGGSSSTSTAATSTTTAPAVATSTATPPPVTETSAAPTPTETPTPTSTLPAGVDQVITVSVAGGKVTGPKGRVKVEKGSTVQIVITSDKADEGHLHGYDKEVPLEAGKPAQITFKATLAGIFDLELHKSETKLLSLQVA